MCNMSCEMCYVRMTKAQMEQSGGRLRTVEEWLRFAEKVREKGMLFLLLTGGEPFLYPNFRELYEQLASMGFIISINTNATMIDEETVKWLVENPPGRMNITLYGASDETYERLCHNPRGYSQVTTALDMLQKAGIMVKLNCSVTPYNIQDLPKMIRFAKEIVRLQNGNERFSEYVSLLEDGAGLMEEKSEECFVQEGDISRCGAGRCAFWITWDGRMLPCGMMTRPVAYPFRDGFTDAWTAITEAVEMIRLPVECRQCSLKQQCQACAAMVLTETDTFTEVPEYRCRMTKCYPEVCRRIQKQEKDVEKL